MAERCEGLRKVLSMGTLNRGIEYGRKEDYERVKESLWSSNLCFHGYSSCYTERLH